MATRSFLIVVLITLLIAACSTPDPVFNTEQYHQQQKAEKTPKALNGLQLQALKLMNQQQYEQAILYLQRAVNIEPRNPLNWHYLGQNYWHLKDFENCRSMVQRAISYSQFNIDLSAANKALLKQCEGH